MRGGVPKVMRSSTVESVETAPGVENEDEEEALKASVKKILAPV